MGLDVSPPGAASSIRGYAEGEIRIGTERHRRALILDTTGRVSSLRPRRPADLLESDLEPVFSERPELVIVGWSGGQTFLPAAQRQWFLTRQIGLEVMALGPACRTFNLLAQDGRRVVALLFPEPPDAA